MLHWSQKWLWKIFWTFLVEVIRPAKLQNSDFQSNFSISKEFSLETINLGAPLLKKLFFDNFIFKKVLFLEWRHQMLIFVGLITSTENIQKNFNVIFVISWVKASFWRVFIKFHWRGQKLPEVQALILTLSFLWAKGFY